MLHLQGLSLQQALVGWRQLFQSGAQLKIQKEDVIKLGYALDKGFDLTYFFPYYFSFYLFKTTYPSL